MKILKKIGGALAIAGLGAAAFAGTIFVAVGTPLLVVGQKKMKEVVDDFAKSELYQTWKEEKDEELEKYYNEYVLKAEEDFKEDKIPEKTYNLIKHYYDSEKKNSNDAFHTMMYTIKNQNYINEYQKAQSMSQAGMVLDIVGGFVGFSKLIIWGWSTVLEKAMPYNVKTFNIIDEYYPQFHSSVGVACLAKQREIIDTVFKDKTESNDTKAHDIEH